MSILIHTYKELEDILDKKEIDYIEDKLYGTVFELRIGCDKIIKTECIDFFQKLFSDFHVLVGAVPFLDFVYIKLLK